MKTLYVALMIIFTVSFVFAQQIGEVAAKDSSFILAASNGDTLALSEFLQKGVDPNTTNSFGYSALMFTVRSKNVAAAKKLLIAGANPNLRTKSGLTALMGAVLDNHLNMVSLLMEYGADPNMQEDKEGRSAISLSSTEPDTCILNILLAHKGNPDLQNKNGITPFMAACFIGNVNAVQVLLNAKANPTLRKDDGRTAFILAKSQGHKKVIELLNKYGINE